MGNFDPSVSPDDLAQQQDDAARAAAARRAALFDTRAGNPAPADQPANIPDDQAAGQQPGSSRLAAMFKDATAGAYDKGTNTSTNPSSTAIISRPDYTQRDALIKMYETGAQNSPGYIPVIGRATRQAQAQKQAQLREAIQLEEAKASGDLSTQQKYQSFFDPKRQGNPIQGRGSDGTLKYFQDVFSREASGAGKMDYQDTGLQPPMDIRKNVMARGSGAGGVIVTPTGDGGYASETYDNRPEPRPLPGGGGKSVPGGFLDAQGTFHKTVEPGQGGGSVKGLTAILNGINASYQIGGPAKMKEHIDGLRENGVPIDEILAQAAQQYGNRGGAAPVAGAPGTSSPPPGSGAAPPGAHQKVTPQGPAGAPPGPGGLVATHDNGKGQYAAQDANGKWVVWGGAPAVARGMGR